MSSFLFFLCHIMKNIHQDDVDDNKKSKKCSYESCLHMKVGGVCPQAYHDNNSGGKLKLHFGCMRVRKYSNYRVCTNCMGERAGLEDRTSALGK